MYGPLYHLTITDIRITPDLACRPPHEFKMFDQAFREIRNAHYGGADYDKVFTPWERLIVLSNPKYARDTSNLTRPYRYYRDWPDGVHFHDTILKWEATKTYVRGLWRQSGCSNITIKTIFDHIVASFPRF